MAKNYKAIIEIFEANVQEDIRKRVGFIQEQVEKAWKKGVVIGISGGLDSAVTTALAVKALGAKKVLGIWMPANSNPVHEKDAQELARTFGLKLITVNLDQTTAELVNAVQSGLWQAEILKPGDDLHTLSKGNSKARARMAVLYAIANQLDYMVVGTCNRTEIYLGYETKGGDQICDFNPIASLVKAQVRILGRVLGVPDSIIDKEPSADLWEGHTDEEEMGFTYFDADRAIITGEGDPEILKKIEHLHRISEHKRKLHPDL